MTEKRFIIDDDGIVTDMVDLSMYIDNEDCCEKLNELAYENEQLKKQLQSEHTMLDNAILLERTRMGQSALKQYKEAIQ